MDLAEAVGESDLLFRRDGLIAEYGHLAFQPRGFDFRKHLVGEVSKIGAVDFGSHGASDRVDGNVPVGVGDV